MSLDDAFEEQERIIEALRTKVRELGLELTPGAGFLKGPDGKWYVQGTFAVDDPAATVEDEPVSGPVDGDVELAPEEAELFSGLEEMLAEQTVEWEREQAEAELAEKEAAEVAEAEAIAERAALRRAELRAEMGDLFGKE